MYKSLSFLELMAKQPEDKMIITIDLNSKNDLDKFELNILWENGWYLKNKALRGNLKIYELRRYPYLWEKFAVN